MWGPEGGLRGMGAERGSGVSGSRESHSPSPAFLCTQPLPKGWLDGRKGKSVLGIQQTEELAGVVCPQPSEQAELGKKGCVWKRGPRRSTAGSRWGPESHTAPPVASAHLAPRPGWAPGGGGPASPGWPLAHPPQQPRGRATPSSPTSVSRGRQCCPGCFAFLV